MTVLASVRDSSNQPLPAIPVYYSFTGSETELTAYTSTNGRVWLEVWLQHDGSYAVTARAGWQVETIYFVVLRTESTFE